VIGDFSFWAGSYCLETSGEDFCTETFGSARSYVNCGSASGALLLRARCCRSLQHHCPKVVI
jgi:hypothetical protein